MLSECLLTVSNTLSSPQGCIGSSASLEVASSFVYTNFSALSILCKSSCLSEVSALYLLWDFFFFLTSITLAVLEESFGMHQVLFKQLSVFFYASSLSSPNMPAIVQTDYTHQAIMDILIVKQSRGD